MTTQLALYNKALSNLGERPLSSLNENTTSRRALDTHFNNVDDLVRYCLEARQWKFALRVVMFDENNSVEPAFGMRYGYERPDDYVKMSAFCSDEYLLSPVDYRDYNQVWYTDIAPIYMSYVSIHEDFGRNLSLWTARFTEFAAAHLAWLTSMRITESADKRAEMFALRKQMLLEAGNLDAMDGPEKRLPAGDWLRSRLGSRGSYHDRGSRSRLIG